LFTGNKIRTSAWNGKEVGLCPQEFSVSFNLHYLSETAVDILIRWIVDPDAGEVLHRAAESPPPDVSLSLITTPYGVFTRKIMMVKLQT